jgi:hypothetical protein
LEGGVVHDVVEGAQTEEAGADVCVEVALGVYGSFGIVDWERLASCAQWME